MFIDRAKIYVRGGNGGNGVTAFRREKFVPRGGPSGGDGGRGGDVIIVADSSLNTLLHLRYNPRHIAERGLHGEGANRSGHTGDDLIVKVPVGTQILDAENGDLLSDLANEGARWLAARGGRGGFGNAHFATSTNRAPRYHQEGSPGEERELQLELKLLADVGLVGFPNVGKSTFISKVSAAKPKIADYPFTTLHPQLGVVRIGGLDFVLADIPGLIEGAHDGAGIGDRFLGHVERTAVLLHLVDATADDPVSAYEIVRGEVEAYGEGLEAKPEVLALSKIDAVTDETLKEKARALKAASGVAPFKVSAVTGEGVEDVLHALAREIEAVRAHRKSERLPKASQGWRP